MTHPGWIGGFPGDWTYQGNAKLLVKDTTQSITISLRLIFIEEAQIDVKLIWEGIPENERLKIASKMQNERQQTLIIQGKLLLIGCSIPPINIGNEPTNFNVVRLVTYFGWSKDFSIREESGYFIQMRAYLNDEFSFFDEIVISEFGNIPQPRNRDGDTVIDTQRFYCALNSGYEVKCGKKYITHKDHNIFYRKNIETLYRLSFVDIKIPLKNQRINNLVVDDIKEIEVSLTRHLEGVLNDLCAFLSIICNYEILPIYYEYSICNQNKGIDGLIIPIWDRRRIPRISKSWFTQGIHFMGNVTAFLECCPLNKQLIRGIQHLNITVYESSVELKLMAACSAIEYFYSYWFWEMNGLAKLKNAVSGNNPLLSLSQKYIGDLKKLNPANPNKTTFLSPVIRFFADDLGIDWKKYMTMNIKDTPQFIQVRNALLHGSFISKDIEIFQAEEVAQTLGTEILFSIMREVSRADDAQLYETLPIRTPEKDFITLSDGWIEIKNIFDELDSEKSSS